MNNNLLPSQERIANNRVWLVALITFAVILADQILKIWVKTHFYLGEDLEITSWWHLKYIENNGMAFGMQLGSKIALTLGRIAAVAVFIWFIAKSVNVAGLRYGFFVICALVTAGAAGNIIDCIFYGEIFNDPMPPAIATLFPAGGGYSNWFEGRVVDMMYFPLFDINFPEWMPLVGGTSFEFFQYIFNIADASICVGVFLLLFFYSKDFSTAFAAIGNKEESKDDRRK